MIGWPLDAKTEQRVTLRSPSRLRLLISGEVLRIVGEKVCFGVSWYSICRGVGRLITNGLLE